MWGGSWIFGGNMPEVYESSEANVYASLASYNDIMVSVLAEIARNYVNYRTSEERLAYARRNVNIQERVTKMTEIQFNSGNVSELDMQQARTQLYNTRTSIPSLELNRIKARNALAILLNKTMREVNSLLRSKNQRYRDPSSRYLSKQKKGSIQIKQNSSDLLNVNIIPYARINPYNKIDAGLLTRRPDIKFAEYKVRSNSALIGSKMAALYPSFTLFGNIGVQQ